jgi:CubicO group peptidase (beta-lactamase class C family)
MTPAGGAAPGFELVAAEFEHVLERSSSGAAFSAVVDGDLVVDLWGGEDWTADTPELIFSGTKGVVAVCLLRLVERGALDLDAPVSRYWPELARDGLLVRHVVSHTAGIEGLRRRRSIEELVDDRAMARAIAAEPSYSQPGERLAYHALTWGWLCGELVRRVDGRSVGSVVAEEISTPLGLDLWLGLPADIESRVRPVARAPDYGVTVLDGDPEHLADVYCGLLGTFLWNDPRVWAAEIPAANAIGTARSLARLYGDLVSSDPLLLRPETVDLGRTELSRGSCAVTGRPYAFGAGWELQAMSALGSPEDAFGHTGSGGSSHGAWPSERVGFSFIPGELWPEARDDRARRLLSALHSSLSGNR